MKGRSFWFSATEQWLAGDVPFHLKWAIEVTHPLQKSLTSTDLRLTNAIFTGLLFEVEQASRGLSAIAELLVVYSFFIIMVSLCNRANHYIFAL